MMSFTKIDWTCAYLVGPNVVLYFQLQISFCFGAKQELPMAIVGDIWSENGISLLAIMGYWITSAFQYRERLLVLEGWDRERHTGDNIKDKTLNSMHEIWGIGETPQKVPEHVFGSTPDEGSNMLKAWKMFEGSGCVTHRASSGLGDALNVSTQSKALVRKIKGIVAHFHRSTKVGLPSCVLSNINLCAYGTHQQHICVYGTYQQHVYVCGT